MLRNKADSWVGDGKQTDLLQLWRFDRMRMLWQSINDQIFPVRFNVELASSRTRLGSSGGLVPPKMRTEFGRKCFLATAVREWNSAGAKLRRAVGVEELRELSFQN